MYSVLGLEKKEQKGEHRNGRRKDYEASTFYRKRLRKCKVGLR